MTREEFQKLAESGVILLDGATGSNLRKAGMPVGVSTELWVLEHPQAIQKLQMEYAEAGSQIIYAEAECRSGEHYKRGSRRTGLCGGRHDDDGKNA